jgi:hypothetical protein
MIIIEYIHELESIISVCIRSLVLILSQNNGAELEGPLSYIYIYIYIYIILKNLCRGARRRLNLHTARCAAAG